MSCSRSHGDRPFKVVSETTREWETFKFEPLLLTDYRYCQNGQFPLSSELTTSSDGVLTALTQLGAYQTGTDRAFVSLFDASHQYIIAEVMPRMSLTPSLPSYRCPAPLALCGYAIPRSHEACEHVLFLECEPSSTTLLPVSVVPDLTIDSRFAEKPMCREAQLGRFYAAMPIRTNRGINIGAYCVIGKREMDTWDDDCSRFMREASRAIMHHLEAGRSKHAYRRNERMNRGLGSFIEGKSTLSGWQHGPNAAAFADDAKLEGALDGTQQLLERQDREEKEQDQRHRAITPSRHVAGTKRLRSSISLEKPRQREAFNADPAASHRMQYPPEQPKSFIEAGTGDVFSKAANIIREAVEVAGCLFYDVTLGSYSMRKEETLGADSENGTSQSGSASGSDDAIPTSPAEAPDGPCELLGHSTSDSSSINSAGLNHGEGFLPRRFLARLFRRYPGGKIFNFDAIGELQLSDSSEDAGYFFSPRGSVDSNTPLLTPTTRTSHGRTGRVDEGSLLRQAFPGARSVAFVPVWDSRRERWVAGCFVYTLTPTRVFTIEGELSFLRAFDRLAASEIQKRETLQADKAKSDVLGSLSHELRSPLHGVIFGTELLNDTELSVFQGNATHTIETCCRTLLDTIDHLLDFSKINSFASRYPQVKTPKSRRGLPSDQFGKKRLHAHVRLDGLVEDVVESLFAGYNFQHMSIRQLSNQELPIHPDTRANYRMDYAQALEQLGPNAGALGKDGIRIGNVSVFLQIAANCNWVFYMPGGAIRRIVMNLFGNSLKFTNKGAIWVTIDQEEPSSKRPRAVRSVKLTVQDTGRGIGRDFLQHRLFTLFSQEDHLAPGTGIGLSLVKTLVSELRGHIIVESQVGSGTTITVTLPLEQSSPDAKVPEDDGNLDEQVRELKGLRVRLSGFGSAQDAAQGAAMGAIIEDMCRHSLHLDMVSEEQAQQVAPDLVVWLDDALPSRLESCGALAKAPNVVICRDALVAYRRFNTYETGEQTGVFDFISQPVGPRKLAKSIQLAYRRWMSLDGTGPPLAVPPQRRICDSPSHAEAPVKEPSLAAAGGAGDFTNADEGVDKILIVDDNHINVKVLSAHMTKLGCAYEAAANGKEAVDTYTKAPTRWAGILMDISMPVMDGLEATRRIRAFEHRAQLRAVPIVALTGLASDSAQREARDSGVDIFLTKPVRLRMLSENLQSMRILQTCAK